MSHSATLGLWVRSEACHVLPCYLPSPDLLCLQAVLGRALLRTCVLRPLPPAGAC